MAWRPRRGQNTENGSLVRLVAKRKKQLSLRPKGRQRQKPTEFWL